MGNKCQHCESKMIRLYKSYLDEVYYCEACNSIEVASDDGEYRFELKGYEVVKKDME